MEIVARWWWIAAYWFSLACVVRTHHHMGHHHLVPVPFPYSAGSYRHTSSVVNVPIYQERIIIIKKPGNHPPHHEYSHSPRHGNSHVHGDQLDQQHKHESMRALDDGNDFRGQESQRPVAADISPFMSYYHAPRSQRYPFFQDVGYILDPRFIQRSLWLEQFPTML